jgi:hypothetical protein
MAAISFVYTIGRVAEMLGEDEDAIEALVLQLSSNQWMAFTKRLAL